MLTIRRGRPHEGFRNGGSGNGTAYAPYIKKAVSFLDRLTDAYVLLIFITILMAGIYITIDTALIYFDAIGGIPIYRPGHGIVKVESAPVENNVAWINLRDTNIDYPIMQGETNTEYLNMDPYGNYSMSGSIFLDYRNDPEFNDDYSLIYGHHMYYGVMFGALDEYRNEKYFDAHRKGILTVNDTDYKIDVFASIDTTSDEETMFNPTEQTREEVLEYLRKNAQIYHEPSGNRLIGLSTCVDTVSSARFILFCSVQKDESKAAGEKEKNRTDQTKEISEERTLENSLGIKAGNGPDPG